MLFQKKKIVTRCGFKSGETIVYPAHGVGCIVGIEEQEVANFCLELFIIHFERDKMYVKVPVAKAISAGMRKLSAMSFVEEVFKVFQGRVRLRRAMWSRRAQEYDAKINSGNLIAVAEVVRDLYHSNSQNEKSYSEKQLYEIALDRMAREVALVYGVSETEAIGMIERRLVKVTKQKKENEARAA